MRYIYNVLAVGIVLLTMMASCKPSLPNNVLSKGKMTDILYDYHVALGMANTTDNGGRVDRSLGIAYKEAVLRKHDVTPAEFDSSMVYYMRHTELLEDVYKDLGDRLGNEIVALGGNGATGGEFSNLSATGDTANIWKDVPALVMSDSKPFNSHSFSLEADTAFHKGDRLRLDFDSEFIFQDGMRDGIALLAIQFQNDSVAQQVVHISSSQHYSVEIADNQNLGIKSVKGYFLLSNGGYSGDMGSQTTLKLMFIEHIKLIRMHAQQLPEPKPAVPSDTLRRDSVKRDSIILPKEGNVPMKPVRMMAR